MAGIQAQRLTPQITQGAHPGTGFTRSRDSATFLKAQRHVTCAASSRLSIRLPLGFHQAALMMADSRLLSCNACLQSNKTQHISPLQNKFAFIKPVFFA